MLGAPEIEDSWLDDNGLGMLALRTGQLLRLTLRLVLGLALWLRLRLSDDPGHSHSLWRLLVGLCLRVTSFISGVGLEPGVILGHGCLLHLSDAVHDTHGVAAALSEGLRPNAYLLQAPGSSKARGAWT